MMDHSKVAERVAKLKSIFVRNLEIDALSEEFDRQLSLRRAEIELNASSEANGIAVI